jgi:hypothetical protein
MAKLLTKLSPGQLNQLAGKFGKLVDFYYWRGIPVARIWPWPCVGHSTPAMKKASQCFATVSKSKKLIHPILIEGYKLLAKNTHRTWADQYQATMMAYYKVYHETPPLALDVKNYIQGGLRTLEITLDKNIPMCVWPITALHLQKKLKQYRGEMLPCYFNSWTNTSEGPFIMHQEGGQPVYGEWIYPMNPHYRMYGVYGDPSPILEDAIASCIQNWITSEPFYEQDTYQIHDELYITNWNTPSEPLYFATLFIVQCEMFFNISSWYTEHPDTDPDFIQVQFPFIKLGDGGGDLTIEPNHIQKKITSSPLTFEIPFSQCDITEVNGSTLIHLTAGPSKQSDFIPPAQTLEQQNGYDTIYADEMAIRCGLQGSTPGQWKYTWQSEKYIGNIWLVGRCMGFYKVKPLFFIPPL